MEVGEDGVQLCRSPVCATAVRGKEQGFSSDDLGAASILFLFD